MEMTISSALERLAELQRLDRALQQKEEELTLVRGELANVEAQLAAQREAVSGLAARNAELETRRKELEAKLAQEDEKMRDRRMRLNRVRNEREQRALQHEIDLAKAANQQMENELIQVMEQLEELEAALRTAREQEAAAEQRYREAVAAHEGTMARLREEVENVRSQRRQLASTIEPELVERYEYIRGRRGGLAVAEVRAAVCQGCNMNLPPQFFNELLRGDEIRLCPNCHRILFYCADDSGGEAA